MRFWSVFAKFGRESLREWPILLLALAFAPFFVIIFHVAFDARPTEYRLAVIDEALRGTDTSGRALRSALEAASFGDDGPRIKVLELSTESQGIESAQKGLADLVLVLSPEFHASIEAGSRPSLRFLGDPASPKYAMLLALTYTVSESWVAAQTGREGVITIEERSIRPEGALSPFDAMMPSLLILSIITVLFTSAALFVRETEKGTIKRLLLSRLSLAEYLSAAALNQLLVSLGCIFLALLTAMALGWELQAPLPAILLVSGLSSLSVIAFGLLTAGFCSSVKDVMIIGNFPYFFLLLFSGAMPLPSADLMTLAGHPLGVGSLFPLSFGVKALEGMMNYGLGPGDLAFELVALILLTAAWFLVGFLLFRFRRLRT
ncbi:MAG: ABC transporter permease [Rectinemataceae bacterium]